MLKNILKVKSLITLGLTLSVITLAILSVVGTIDVNHLTQNPLIICVISAFTASYTSLYVNNKDKADESIQATVRASERAMGWTADDIARVMHPAGKAEQVAPAVNPDDERVKA
jgi:hypothetical protein